MGCLQRSPEERYLDVGELMEDVQRYLGGQPVHTDATLRGFQRNRYLLPIDWKIRLGVLAVLAFLACGAWFLWA